MAGAMAAELKPLVRLQCAYFTVMSLLVYISSLIAITIAFGCCPRPLHSILEMWSDFKNFKNAFSVYSLS